MDAMNELLAVVVLGLGVVLVLVVVVMVVAGLVWLGVVVVVWRGWSLHRSKLQK